MARHATESHAQGLSEIVAHRRFSWPEATRVALRVAEQVSELHGLGQLHRAIEPDRVLWINADDLRLQSAPQQVTVQPADMDRWPPELAAAAGVAIPLELSAAQEVLRSVAPDSHPFRIDIYQICTLLLRLGTGRSASDYLLDPLAKSEVPPAFQAVLGAGLGFDTLDRFEDTAELIAALNSAMEAVCTSEMETPPTGHIRASDTPHSSAEASDAFLLPADSDAKIGRYRLLSQLGHGGMGDVYRAWDHSLNREVALKVLPSTLARDHVFVQRFRTEAEATAQLQHPHIVIIHDVGCDQGRHFFAMQLIEGESLHARLKRVARLPIREAVALVRQCLLGLEAAHRAGLIHRDIKPGNILIETGTERAVLVDFGLVQRLGEETRLTATGVVMGTLDYLSPEQARGLSVDGRTDLYALGIVLYQSLSGRMPFSAESPTAMIFQHAYEAPFPLGEAAPDVPASLLRIVERLMAKRPEDRYADCTQALADVDAWLADHPLPSELSAASQEDEPFASEIAEQPGQRHASRLNHLAPQAKPMLRWGVVALGIAVATAIGWQLASWTPWLNGSRPALTEKKSTASPASMAATSTEPRNFQELFRITRPGEAIVGDMDPKGEWFLLVKHNISRYRLSTTEPQVFIRPDGYAHVARFSHDGSKIAVAYSSRMVRVYDREGTPITKPFDAEDHIYDVSISNDGSTVIITRQSLGPLALDLASEQLLPIWSNAEQMGLNFPAPQGNWVAMISFQDAVLRNLENDVSLDVGPDVGFAGNASWHPTGRAIWLRRRNGDVVLTQVPDIDKIIHEVPAVPAMARIPMNVLHALKHHQGVLVVGASEDSLHLIDTRLGRSAATVSGLPSASSVLRVTDDDRTLLTLHASESQGPLDVLILWRVPVELLSRGQLEVP
jgi:serine/threonine protein kinase